MLCANGGQNGANLNQAVYDYNHSQAYVTEVLDLAQTFGQTQAQTVAAGTAGGGLDDTAALPTSPDTPRGAANAEQTSDPNQCATGSTAGTSAFRHHVP